MSTDAKPGQSELAAALREMLDGFREVGVLFSTDVDRATLLAAPDEHSIKQHQV